MDKFGKIWSETTKKQVKTTFQSNLQHTHNALADALEQVEIFENY